MGIGRRPGPPARSGGAMTTRSLTGLGRGVKRRRERGSISVLTTLRVNNRAQSRRSVWVPVLDGADRDRCKAGWSALVPTLLTPFARVPIQVGEGGRARLRVSQGRDRMGRISLTGGERRHQGPRRVRVPL